MLQPLIKMSFLDALIPGSVTYDLYVKSISCQTVNQGGAQLITPYTTTVVVNGAQFANPVNVTAIVQGYVDYPIIMLKEFTLVGGNNAATPAVMTITFPNSLSIYDISGSIFYIGAVAGSETVVFMLKPSGNAVMSVSSGVDGFMPVLADEVNYAFKGTTLIAISP